MSESSGCDTLKNIGAAIFRSLVAGSWDELSPEGQSPYLAAARDALAALSEQQDASVIDSLIEYQPTPFEVSGEDREAYRAMFLEALKAVR